MKNKAILSGILALTLLGACKSATTIVENDVGIMQGKVAIYTNCNELSNDSGAAVQIEGTGFSATTNFLGDWTMNNVPAGIYNIIITKPGFDTELISQYHFSGAGTQFIENAQISSESPLLDSVLISSIQITKTDSIQTYRMDSIRQNPYDTIWWNVYDTVSYIYAVSITYTMSGPDSAVYFHSQITDMTALSDSSDLWGELSYFNNFSPTIAQNQSLTQIGTIYSIIATRGYWAGSPHPGDMIVVKTIPTSTCEGRKSDTLSRSFVLP